MTSLTAAGDTNWIYQINGPWFITYANSVVYGADGNIYAAGSCGGLGSPNDFLVISLTATGYTNWAYFYNGPGDSWDEANSVVYGADGNIYAAGRSGDPNDITVISLTSAGDTNWVYRYDGPGNSYDIAYSLIYGADSNIYVAGVSYNGSSTHEDFIVISLTTAGDANWVYRYDGPANDDDEAYSVVYGADGNVYAAGGSFGNGTSEDFIVISLTTAGDTNWIYRYDEPANGTDGAYSIIYCTDGNIYAAGYNSSSGTYEDIMVISLTTAGDTNWVYRYNGSANFADIAYSLAYGADGNIYVAGVSYGGTSTMQDILVISLTTAGDANWIYRFDGPVHSSDCAYSLACGMDGNVYAAGISTGAGTYYDFTVISLDPDYGVQEENATVRKFNFSATIMSGLLKLPEGKTCRVFDITGRVVMPDKMKPGVYFLQIDGKMVSKIVKVK